MCSEIALIIASASCESDPHCFLPKEQCLRSPLPIARNISSEAFVRKIRELHNHIAQRKISGSEGA
jgi:hypothetical protein